MPFLRTSPKWKLNDMKRFATKLCQEPKSRVSNETMTAWHINSYGKLNQLEMGPVQKPIVSKPKQVLVKVNAASVNPIDVAMLGGYGNVMLDLMRKCNPCDKNHSFPLILGRDFSGEIVSKGADVRPELKVGDSVYGVIPVHSQGSHSEFVVAEECLLAPKPDHLTHEEASGILYAAMTAWSSLKITGDLFITGASGKKVLVIGGSGGVGTFAVQLLKAWGAEVTATCRDDAVPLVEKLGADFVIDYAQPNWLRDLQTCGKFDIIFDASGNVTPSVYIPMLSEWKNAKFITLKSPLLKNTDSFGLVRGMLLNLGDLVAANLNSGAIKKGTTVRWGYFVPVPTGIYEITNLVSQKQLTPVVDKIFPFTEVPAAFDKVIEGHLRGKIIVSANKKQEQNEQTQ